MSYSIFIGEPEIAYYPEDNYMKIKVKEVTCKDAPEFGFGDGSGKTNGRFPGYARMWDFCKEVGLYEMFFDEDEGLLRDHPGCKPITEKHLNLIREARIKWEKQHPNCKDLLPIPDKVLKLKYSKQFDWVYARLIWYEFWFEWALKNCKMPSIENY